jgi:hypothetical protein
MGIMLFGKPFTGGSKKGEGAAWKFYSELP